MTALVRTLAQLRAGGRSKADQEKETVRHPDTAPSGSESDVTTYANKGVRWVSRVLASIKGYEFYGRTWYVLGDVTSSGTSPPDVTFTGTPVDEYTVYVEITDANAPAAVLYSITLNGEVYTTGTLDSRAETEVALVGTGITVTFPIDTYSTGNTWTVATTYPTVTPNIRWRAVPADVMHIHSVSMVGADGRTYKLHPVSQTQEIDLEDALSESDGYPTHYQFRGHSGLGSSLSVTGGSARIDLYPRPTAAHQIVVKYTPNPGNLVQDADTWDGICGHEEAVEYFIAKEISEKDGKLEWAKYCQAQLDRWEKTLRTMPIRKSGDAPMVKDVRGRRGPMGPFQARRRFF